MRCLPWDSLVEGDFYARLGRRRAERTVLITFPDLLIIVTVSVTFIMARCLSCRCRYRRYCFGEDLLRST